ncbi:L-type lectin-domain containing protein [Neobacillus mesonae]|uniref:L-type lectin-domain containing protein n=1 Tax=Neobacillus mesonae TaxID=1193713 RepID=UPI00204208D5|nr:L-type lectin-domain containing protein [Neobacillus mesonae]MCM3568628.1 L-type lectin-domain containing protein [Neobacillus mesonae]
MGLRPICFTFDDFSDPSDLTLNGSATTINSGGQTVLRLTGASTSQAGSAFTTETFPLSNGFSTFFSFQMTDPGGGDDPSGDGPGADGIVFMVQSNSNTALGAAGGGIGYFEIPNSAGVEFDTFLNVGFADPNGNHVGVDTEGSVNSIATSIALPDRLNNGTVWFAWVDYSPVTNILEVRVSTTNVRPAVPTLTAVVDIPLLLGSSEGYIGFSAGTGALFENHDILSWEFCSSAM